MDMVSTILYGRLFRFGLLLIRGLTMVSSITFDKLQVTVDVFRHRHAAIIHKTVDGSTLGLLRRVGTTVRCHALVWHPNPSYLKPPACPLEVFETVATMI